MTRVFSLVVAAACLTAPVSGDVVVHFNTNRELIWSPLRMGFLCPGEVTNNYLDLTLPATQDADVQTGSSIAYDVCTGASSNDCELNYIRLGEGMQIAQSDHYALTPGCNPGQDKMLVVRLYRAGYAFGNDANWAEDTPYAFSRQSGGQFPAVDFPGALGVRFLIEGQTHYGFVALSNVGEPTMWAWETTPGSGIRVQNPVCPADWNLDGYISSQDFFEFLNRFFENDADYNGNTVTNMQDLFDFLNDFFDPC